MNLYRHIVSGRVYAVLAENAVLESGDLLYVVCQGIDESETKIFPVSDFIAGHFMKLRPSDVGGVMSERERCAKIAARYVDVSTCMSCNDANRIMEDICTAP